jgi:3-hexulose-6-phosphate synthase
MLRMKLQIAFDLTDLEKALACATQVHEHADILEIGSLLVYGHGVAAISRFREKFPDKTLVADIKLADRSNEAVDLCIRAGADWVTVMAGTGRNVIHTACTTAHEQGKKILLDLMDASSLGQSALDAKSLGVDALLFHKPANEDTELTLLDRWDMVRGNTSLPVFVSAPVTRENIHDIIAIKPNTIVIGSAITEATDPAAEAAYYKSVINTP